MNWNISRGSETEWKMPFLGINWAQDWQSVFKLTRFSYPGSFTAATNSGIENSMLIKNLINPSISFIYFYLYEKLSSNICMLLFEQWRYARIRTLFVVFFRSICPIVCRLSISLLNIIMLDMVRTYIFTFLC